MMSQLDLFFKYLLVFFPNSFENNGIIGTLVN